MNRIVKKSSSAMKAALLTAFPTDTGPRVVATAAGRSMPGTSDRSACVSVAISLALVVDEALAEPDLHQRDREDHHEEHPGQRGGVAHLEELERVPEQVDHVEQR